MRNAASAAVDAAVNIFAKPYSTSLSLLSLLRFSGRHIDRIYMQFEPYGSRHDAASPYTAAEYLRERMGDRVVTAQPEYWLDLNPPEREKLHDFAYRLGIRYEYAFERTDKKYLFVLHNDVLIKADIIGALLGKIGDGFAAGSIGQCWNCPAADAETARLAGFAYPCSPDAYGDFRPDFAGLEALYDAALATGRFVRPYRLGWDEHYRDCAWPLPECRVNEWGCLVDVEQTRPLVIPEGDILPFGAYEQCGPIALDIAVPWFRELNRRGLRAYNFAVGRYLTHWGGTGKMRAYSYNKVEAHARHLLMKGFPDFVAWCRVKKNRMFD